LTGCLKTDRLKSSEGGILEIRNVYFFKSLTARFVLTLTAALLSLLLAGLSYFLYEQKTTILKEEEDKAQMLISGLITGLQTVMLPGDGILVLDWINRVKKHDGIIDINIWRVDGSRAFTDLKTVSRINSYLKSRTFRRAEFLSDNAKLPDNIKQAALSSGQSRIKDIKGDTLTYVIPINNEIQCLSCHGYEKGNVLGLLSVVTSLSYAKNQIELTKMKSITMGFVAVLLLGSVVLVLVRMQVILPVRGLAEATKKIASGDMSVRVNFKDGTEIGVLADLFNNMAERLQKTTVSRDYVNSIMESIGDCLIVTDAHGIVQSANNKAREVCSLLGVGAQGFSIKDIIKIDLLKNSSLLDAFLNNWLNNMELSFADSSVRQTTVLFSASAIQETNGNISGFVFTGKDITYLKELRDDLVKSKENFYSIVLKSPDGLLIVDDEGRVRFGNPAAERMLGRKAEELHGMLFGFPVAESMVEIDIIRPDGQRGIAEMRAMKTYWHGIAAYLVSLRDVTENVKLREELRAMSLNDDLTGLYNRRGFFAVADQHLKMAQRMKRKMFLLFVDMNGFKDINDTYGHKAGDNALIEMANILKHTFRGSDIVARMGGDEFIVLAIEGNSCKGYSSAERLIESVFESNKSGSLPFTLSMSIGSACYDPDNPSTIDDLIAVADKLMYDDKTNKKNNG
jgi:diguanylate cyclase (GGDEF)-like protein